MSINADFNVPADNPFVDLSSLKDANLTEGEKTILSNCKYEELQKKWCANVNLIAQLNSKHLNRNVNANSNPVFPNAGPSNAKNLKEAGKQVFRDWGEFNKHIMYKIPREMYKKIAQTNPHYFDKVIEHLDTIADTLKKEGTQDWGSINADLFRITAGYLRRMMHGDGAAKPENNNANPGANREQPTIINHYHNNIQFGNNYNNYGHIGNNNFYNKGGNMAVMFKESSNGVPNTSFRPEYSVSKSEHSFYSPTINGIKVLDVTAENALKLLGQDKSEEKENDKVNVGFKTNKNEQNVEGYHTMRNLYSKVHVPKKSKETSETLLKTYHNLVKTTKPEDPPPEKDKKLDAVEQKKDIPENIKSRLRKLLGKYVAFWEQIHNGKEEYSKDIEKLIDGINENEINGQKKMILKSLITPLRGGCKKTQAEQIFTLLDNIKDPVLKLKILGHVIERLGGKLSERNESGMDNEYTNGMGAILDNIASVISDKNKATYIEKHGLSGEIKKINSKNEVVDGKDPDMTLQGITYTPKKDEKNLPQGEICNKLYEETKAILSEILPYTSPQANEQKN